MPGQPQPSREQLRDIAKRWVEAGWQRCDTEAVRAMYAPTFVDLGNPSGRPGTTAENVENLAQLYAAFPDFFTTIEDLIIDAEAGKVAVRWSATGTHRGHFLGIPPTGRRITFRGIESLHVEDGLIVERSGEWDGVAILQQLGALP
jgi:steroid delta-isomerase-like uncharacterized protein